MTENKSWLLTAESLTIRANYQTHYAMLEAFAAGRDFFELATHEHWRDSYKGRHCFGA